jgi:hypothetical protein
MKSMNIDLVEVQRPQLGGDNGKECPNCHGQGYIEVGSTTDPEENEFVECEVCETLGTVELEASDIF